MQIVEEMVIPGFPNYKITSDGRVFNLRTEKEMMLSPTLNGDLTVGLVREHRQYRYSVKGLVARAFVDGETELFNTPILLDGDKHNLKAENILWRPRWFAWLYTRQFATKPDWYFFGPLVDTTTNTPYPDYLTASITNGILCADIRESIYSGHHVFPTRQRFAYAR